MPGVDKVALVRRAFDLFDGGAFDELLQLLAPDVQWPDFRDGSQLQGRDAVRAYWAEQFALATPSVLLGQTFEMSDGVIAIAHEQLYDHDGRPVGEPAIGTFHFRFRGDMIASVEHSRLGEVSDEVLDLLQSGRTEPDRSS